jgi:S-adenosyl-L-methionine hydrolase (adenosine-forming)
MGRRFDTISFLTDYGIEDEFVGVVKAIVRDLAPHVQVIDLTHAIAPYDVRAGSLALARSIPYVPSGVVLAVVDPGVGTARRAVAIEVAGGEGVLVGPDNGLLAPAVALAGGAERAVVLDIDSLHLQSPGATFAGRDIFAPVAAQLCNGLDLHEVGTPVDTSSLLPGVIPLPREEADGLQCEVLWVDHFGNCQLNIGPDDIVGWGDRVRLRVPDPTGGTTIRSAAVARNFEQIGLGAIGLVVDSSGMLAVAVDRGSAADQVPLHVGAEVTLLHDDSEEPRAPETPVTLGRRPS